MKQPWQGSLISCLTKAWSGWSLNSRSRMNDCNGVQGVGLENGTVLVRAEPGTVIGTTPFIQVAGKLMADWMVEGMTGLLWSLAAWLCSWTMTCVFAPLQHQTLAAVGCEIYLWLECFSGTPAPMICWPCVHCGARTHYPKIVFFVPNLCMNPEEDHTHYPPQHPLEDSTYHLLYPTLDNPVTVDQPWSCEWVLQLVACRSYYSLVHNQL